MTQETMAPRPRWGNAELETLLSMAGDVPGALLPRLYNSWARGAGYCQRTRSGMVSKIRECGGTTVPLGSWLTVGSLATVLGIPNWKSHGWASRGQLKARQFGGPWATWYCRREDVAAFARRHPELFGGVLRADLVALLEDEDLADWIRERHPRKAQHRRPVLCVETGWRYESVRAAAKAWGVHPNSIQQSLRLGIRAAGRHWRDAA